MNAFPLLLLLAVAPCALGNPVANYLKNLAESATVQSMTLNYLECQDGAKTPNGNACQTGKARVFEIKNLKCTVKLLKQSAACVSGTVEVGPPGYIPPFSVHAETVINLADKTGKIGLTTPPNWKAYGFKLTTGQAYLQVDDQGIKGLSVVAAGSYELKDANGNDRLKLSMDSEAIYERAKKKLEAKVYMSVQVGKRTGKTTDIPVLYLVGQGIVVSSNPTINLVGAVVAGSQGWQPFANGPYAQRVDGLATITNAGLSAVRLRFEVGWTDIDATLPTEIPFNKCPLPSCKTQVCKKVGCDSWGWNCKKDANGEYIRSCSWTGGPSACKALRAGCSASGNMFPGCYALKLACGRRSLLFGPLPRNGSTPLDTQMDLEPTYNSLVGEVRVGDSTVFAGDMTGYAEDAGDELSLGTEKISFTDKGIALSVLGHKCEMKLKDCDVATTTSTIQVKVKGTLHIDVTAAKMWGEVDLKSEGSLAVIPFTRPIDLGFTGAVFDRKATNKLDITSALDDLSFCALVNKATTGGMGNLPIGWAGKSIESNEIYETLLGSYLVTKDNNKYLDMGKVLAGIVGQSIVDALAEFDPSKRDALKIEQSRLPDLTIPLIPAYSGTLGSAFSAVGGDQMCTT